MKIFQCPQVLHCNLRLRLSTVKYPLPLSLALPLELELDNLDGSSSDKTAAGLFTTYLFTALLSKYRDDETVQQIVW